MNTYLFIDGNRNQRLVKDEESFKDALKTAGRYFDNANELFYTAVDAVPDNEPETMVKMYNQFSEWRISQVWAITGKIY